MSDTLQMQKPSAYRWLMLILVSLPNFGTNYAQFQLSAFAADFMADFGLTTVQFSAVTLSFSVVAGIIGVCGGTLADRLGTRRVAVTLCFVTAAASLGRLLTHSYGVFFLLSLFVGCGLGAVPAPSGMIISAWFPQKEASFAFSG
ncbi:MAG: MFS transporter, partial [Clostridiales bacterium]|nr:MFS transporter [Clostridiales bacterium]